MIQKTGLIVFLSALLMSLAPPAGWTAGGNARDSYAMEVAPSQGLNGGSCATIRSIGKAKGFGTLMQRISAKKYAGKLIRVKVYMKISNVRDDKWAGFWVSVDKQMHATGVKHDKRSGGNTDWQQYELSINVPLNAETIAYGGQLAGTGQLWFDDVRIETEGDMYFAEPQNPDFEK